MASDFQSRRRAWSVSDIFTVDYGHEEHELFSEIYGDLGVNMDYRCEGGRFLVFASCVTLSNPDSLTTGETGVNPGMRS
jgi:hypothetical protein